MERDRRNNQDQICSPWETQRRKALTTGLRIVAENETALAPEGADILRAQLLSGFVQGEVMAQINERLSTSKIIRFTSRSSRKK